MCWGAVLLQPSETKLAVLFLASPFADYDDNDYDGDAAAERELLYLLYSSTARISDSSHLSLSM